MPCFFTREQLVTRLCFPVHALVKQFLHFTRAPSALVHPNVIRILIVCSVLNFLYQLDLSLVDIFFAYSLILRRGGWLSFSILDSRLQFVNGLPDSPKMEAKGVILVRGLGMKPRALLTYRFILTGRSASQVCVGTRKWAKFRFIHMTLRATDFGLLMQGKNGEVGWCSG